MLLRRAAVNISHFLITLKKRKLGSETAPAREFLESLYSGPFANLQLGRRNSCLREVEYPPCRIWKKISLSVYVNSSYLVLRAGADASPDWYTQKKNSLWLCVSVLPEKVWNKFLRCPAHPFLLYGFVLILKIMEILLKAPQFRKLKW